RRNRQSKVVRATPEHEWLYRTGGRKFRVKTTQELRPGDRLAYALPPRVEVEMVPEGVRHGIVYGDGTVTGKNSSTVYLWGDKDKQLVRFFEMVEGSRFSPAKTDNGVEG